MPRRPTKEFWDEVYPDVLAGLRKSGRGDGERAARITASIWHTGLKPSTKERFEVIRRRRERR